MKTLKKIHLKSVSEFLSDKEMKVVAGGAIVYGDGTDDGPFQLGEVVITGDLKIVACVGSKEGERCEWADSRGVSQYGYCKSYFPDYVLHCSDLAFA